MKPNLLSFKKLLVQPNGHITGGWLSYSIDDQSGVISYQGSVDVHIFFISYTFPVEGTYQADPALVLSKNVKPGMRFAQGGVSIEVLSVSGFKAQAKLSITGNDVSASGLVNFDLSGTDVAISDADVTGTIKGYDAELQLRS